MEELVISQGRQFGFKKLYGAVELLDRLFAFKAEQKLDPLVDQLRESRGVMGQSSLTERAPRDVDQQD